MLSGNFESTILVVESREKTRWVDERPKERESGKENSRASLQTAASNVSFRLVFVESVFSGDCKFIFPVDRDENNSKKNTKK